MVIGTWNVRSLRQIGKMDNLIQEMEEMKIDILGVAETHWKESGEVRRDSHTFLYSGGERHIHGVGILLNNKGA